MTVVIDGTIGVNTPGLDSDGVITSRAVGGGEGGQLNLLNPDNVVAGLTVDVSTADVGRIFSVRNNSTLMLGQLGGTGGIVSFYTAAAEQARITAAGLFQFNSGYGSVATAYGCRAWANFNGLLTGTNAPRAGGNVTSVTRSSAGIYTVNFTVAFPDTNYTMIATSGSLSPTSGFSIAMGNNTFTTSTAQVYVTNNVAAVADNAVVGVAFFR